MKYANHHDGVSIRLIEDEVIAKSWNHRPTNLRLLGVRTANEATTQFSQEMVQNQETTANRVVYSSQQYQTDMNQAIDRQAGAQVAGVNAGAGQAIGGFQRAAGQARTGVEQNYQLELGANQRVYVSQFDAAGQIRSAGFEAAKLRQAAAVITQVGREISREVGQGMRIRF